MIEEKDILKVGKFFRTHALKGELNTMTEGYEADLLDTESPLIVEMDGIFVPFYVESWRPKGMFGCLVKLEGIDTQERAQEFVNKFIYMRREDVADALGLDPDELNTEEDFVGFRVEVEGIGYIGRVEEIDSTTDNLLLVVKPDDSDKLIYIPLVEEFLVSIDEKEDGNDADNTIVLRLPDGILDLND
ncbi:MAG: ribosome maturation factor RimM [Muribaculaceae bacterium]|nr:ribosome maturation factor RimM [Muribaculaceae bacterium]